MANPLKGARGGDADKPLIILNTDFDKRAFCHDQNFRNKWARNVSRWHYLEPAKDRDSQSAMMIATDTNADEVWTVIDGKRVDYRGWSKEKLNAVGRRARWLIAQGMLTPTELNGRAA